MHSSGGHAIRRGQPEDAPALAQLAAATFTETFGHLYRPEDLHAFLTGSQTVATYGPLLQDPRIAIWVVVRPSGKLCGFLTAGPCKLPVPGLEATAGEIRQIYLHRAVQRLGIGTCLLQTGLAWLYQRGRKPIYVGVWSENTGAQRLYARYGFEKIGEYDFPVGQHLDREFILKRQ